MNNIRSGRRHLTRVSVLTLGLLGSAILGKADIPQNGIFTITYGGWGDTATNLITFTITTESPDQMSLAGYSNNVCLACFFAAAVPDPFMDIDPGGDAPPFPQVGGMISIPPDTQSFQNTNTFDIRTLDFTTPFLSMYDGETFTCGGNEFVGCGFKLDGQTLDIRFTGPMVAPEPSSWVLLLTVAAGITLKRAAPFSKRS